ncbi:hypothetical protein [Bacillus badius]|uniref:hypothetical protein n=1 Tax=Bacillus badius TaxID=1455 RepID=UPI000597E048|nr:hypothetical protein [Bacillus badius]KIL74353.1 hypothetical protein SD78_1422 [Bacillus badius]
MNKLDKRKMVDEIINRKRIVSDEEALLVQERMIELHGNLAKELKKFDELIADLGAIPAVQERLKE